MRNRPAFAFALVLLALLERARGSRAEWITTFGRVPLLYYVAHIFLIHALAVAAAALMVGDASWLFGGPPPASPKAMASRCPGSMPSGSLWWWPSIRFASGSRT